MKMPGMFARKAYLRGREDERKKQEAEKAQLIHEAVGLIEVSLQAIMFLKHKLIECGGAGSEEETTVH